MRKATASIGTNLDRTRRCVVCDQPLPPRSPQSKNTCDHWRCRLENQKSKLAQTNAQDAALIAERQLLLDKATSIRDSSATSNDFLVVLTPVNKRPLVGQPRKRKYRFLRNLIKIVEKVWLDTEFCNSVEPLAEQNSNRLPVLDAACTNCRGRCCFTGGVHAFLDEKTIARFIQQHPGIDFNEIVSAYLERLPEQAYQDSCVFHSDTGCTLPRSMRSATCENTICGGISELIARVEIDGDKQFFLAAADRQNIIRTTISDD